MTSHDDDMRPEQREFLQRTQDDSLLDRAGPSLDRLTLLGSGPQQAQHNLERFECPPKVERVEFVTEELICACPMTHQRDVYRAKITTLPDEWCIETKSLKLYLWTFGEREMFAEVLAEAIARDVFVAIEPISVEVELVQNMRGGIITIVRAKEQR